MIWLWKTEGAWSGDPEALARKTWIRRTGRDLNASLKPQLKKPWGPEAVRGVGVRGMFVGEGVWLDYKVGGMGGWVQWGKPKEQDPRSRPTFLTFFLPVATLCQQVYIS